MNSKKLLALILVLLCLVFLFINIESADHKSSSSTREAFPDIADKVSSLLIEQGVNSVELKVEDNHWVVPARANYFADGGKINALILRVTALSLFHKVTDNAERHDFLGVGVDVKKSGKTKITFFDRDRQSLGALFIGEQSESNASSKTHKSNSYYVRKEGENSVYLVGESLAVRTNPEYWLLTQIVNIEQNAIKYVGQFKLSADAEVSDFGIERKPDTGKEEMFHLSGDDLNKGENEEVVGSIASGLVNLRFDDVIKDNTDFAKPLIFDKITHYMLVNGIKYKVYSAYEDGKYYIKISVSFDPQGSDTLKTAQISSETKQASSASSFNGLQEVERQSGQFSGWIFRVPEYIGTKFRKTIDDVTEKGNDN